MAKGKGILALLASAPKGDDSEEEMPEEETSGSAEDLLDAIASKDPAAVKEAFRSLYHECSGEE